MSAQVWRFSQKKFQVFSKKIQVLNFLLFFVTFCFKTKSKARKKRCSFPVWLFLQESFSSPTLKGGSFLCKYKTSTIVENFNFGSAQWAVIYPASHSMAQISNPDAILFNFSNQNIFVYLEWWHAPGRSSFFSSFVLKEFNLF